MLTGAAGTYKFLENKFVFKVLVFFEGSAFVFLSRFLPSQVSNSIAFITYNTGTVVFMDCSHSA